MHIETAANMDMDRQGWPAFGAGWGEWQTVRRDGTIRIGRRRYSDTKLVGLVGRRVYVPRLRDGRSTIIDDEGLAVCTVTAHQHEEV